MNLMPIDRVYRDSKNDNYFSTWKLFKWGFNNDLYLGFVNPKAYLGILAECLQGEHKKDWYSITRPEPYKEHTVE